MRKNISVSDKISESVEVLDIRLSKFVQKCVLEEIEDRIISCESELGYILEDLEYCTVSHEGNEIFQMIDFCNRHSLDMPELCSTDPAEVFDLILVCLYEHADTMRADIDYQRGFIVKLKSLL